MHDVLPPGRYLLKTKVVAQANVPIIGTVDTTTITLAFVDIHVHQGQAIGEQKICQVMLGDQGDLARTIFPQNLIEALPKKRIRFDLSLAPDFPMRLQVDLGEETMGYLSNLPGSPLPASESSPEVVDVDKDGRPGATLYLELPGIGLYPLGIVSKGHTFLDGWLSAPGQAEGSATLMKFQQRVLSGLPVEGEVRNVKAVPARSHFELSPVEQADDCTEIIDRARAS